MECINRKFISDLNGMSFYVPAYQRGYRWTEQEVIALLDDVSKFDDNNDMKYCLQPLLVQQREDNSYEVVDGQQRLTTIYIFLKVVGQELFKIQFETRNRSRDFLENLKEGVKNTELVNGNIDFYYIAQAYKTISNWLDINKKNDKDELIKKFKDKVFFIWYILPKENKPVDIFTKVNLGKIPLTNAELIKALILSGENIDSGRQKEISIEWDLIEQGLRDDSFWYFLNEREDSGTRIDMLFEILAKEDKERAVDNKIDTNQRLFSFLVFYAEMEKRENGENKGKFIDELWTRVKNLYAQFQDWYEDLDKYHIIGFLISSGMDLWKVYTGIKDKQKSACMDKLIENIKHTLSFQKKYKSHINSKEINKENILVYLNECKKGENDKQIRKILLAFNIITLICNGNKQYRFPFDIYKKGKWDIEHIHATADPTGGGPDNSLWNLTLLDSATNRSPDYGNNCFNKKRQVILEREKEGLFVPLCTKNVFLRLYTKKQEEIDMTQWNDLDKEDYINEMADVFDRFFKKEWVKNND